MTVRPATRRDITRFYGKPPEHTQRAVVGRVNGRMVALGGIAWSNGKVYAFVDMKPTAKKFPVRLIKECKNIIKNAQASGVKTMYAIKDPNEQTARRFLEHLGFVETAQEGVWRCQA